MFHKLTIARLLGHEGSNTTVPGHPAAALSLRIVALDCCGQAAKQIAGLAKTIAMTMTKNGAASAGLVRQTALAPSCSERIGTSQT